MIGAAAMSMSLQSCTDEELFLQHRDGDPRALAMLLERYRRPLTSFLVRTVHDRALAEEVFVDTFLALHKASDRYEPQGAFRSFVFRIARNRAVSALRRAAERVGRAGLSIDAPIGVDDPRPRLQLVHGGAGPERHTSAKRRLEQVEAALNRLPERHRSALLLYNVEGIPYPEISEILGVPLGTVKTWIHQARKGLRKELGEEFAEVGR
jgi:RNA polymerase sigma-70 factor (ECF subfamily)